MSSGINLQNVYPEINNPQGNFDLSFRRKLDHAFGELIPFCMLPVMPNDNMDITYSSVLTRMAPFVSQVYQDYIATVDWYFVPNRILWKNFNNFLTGGYNGESDYVHPTIDIARIHKTYGNPDSHHHLFNYLDVPNSFIVGAGENVQSYPINCFPFYAYIRCILDHWIGTGTQLNALVEQYVNSDTPLCDDGDNTDKFIQWMADLNSGLVGVAPPEDVDFSTLFSPIWRLYPLDYFTMARPNPQLGPVMTIPLQLINTDRDGTQTFRFVSPSNADGLDGLRVRHTIGSDQIVVNAVNNQPNVVVNGSVFNNVATINDFYSAARVQELLTLYNYTGFSSENAVAAEFGVRSKDNRLHRSDHLSHYQEQVVIGEVFSNSVSTGDSATRDIPGVGTAIGKSLVSDRRGFHFYSGEDYGFLVGLYSIYPTASYNQGLPRIYRDLDRFDYPHPKLSQIGMHSIRMQEIFADSQSFQNWDNDFAYLPPYSHYKVSIDHDNGSFAGSLQYMSAGRRFSMPPVFNDQFLRVIPSLNGLNRTFNNSSYLPTSTPLQASFDVKIYANRQLPYYGLPVF